MSRLVFIEPKAPNLHIFSKFPLPRLGILLLGTIMKARGWDVEVFIEEMRPIDFDVIRRADLVGISTITSTAPRAYALADKVRETGIPVILGGPHVSFMAEEAMEHADFVIRGEGERSLPALIEAWQGSRDYSGIPNLSYRSDGRVVHNPFKPCTEDLDELPSPDFSLLGSERYGGKSGRIIPVQTSRGCPFDCSFCSVTGMFGREYRFRSTAKVIEELRLYDDRRNTVFFYDDNFAANPKRAKELLRAMIREGFRFAWTTQVRADVARDEELVGLMKEAGCRTVFIGFESVNSRSLEAMKKRQTVAEMRRAARVLRRRRIHVHGMFVYGFDQDDWETVKQTVRFAKRARLNSTQFLILTPLPGSEFFNQVSRQDRITFHDWALYDAHHVVFQPAHFSLRELQRAQIFSHRKFYSLREMVKKFLKGKWLDLGIAGYARKLNRVWRKKNKTFLRVVDLLRPRPGTRISIDYREEVKLDS
jgi:radical SAM superfamily enzyme YgiQ (UPF0313 family)